MCVCVCVYRYNETRGISLLDDSLLFQNTINLLSLCLDLNADFDKQHFNILLIKLSEIYTTLI